LRVRGQDVCPGLTYFMPVQGVDNDNASKRDGGGVSERDRGLGN